MASVLRNSSLRSGECLTPYRAHLSPRSRKSLLSYHTLLLIHIIPPISHTNSHTPLSYHTLLRIHILPPSRIQTVILLVSRLSLPKCSWSLLLLLLMDAANSPSQHHQLSHPCTVNHTLITNLQSPINVTTRHRVYES